MAYTLPGDAVHAGARLTQRAGGAEILIFMELAVRTPHLLDSLQVEDTPLVSLEGKDAPVPDFRAVEHALPGAVFENGMPRTRRSDQRRRA